jgi:hypothetical protein
MSHRPSSLRRPLGRSLAKKTRHNKRSSHHPASRQKTSFPPQIIFRQKNSRLNFLKSTYKGFSRNHFKFEKAKFKFKMNRSTYRVYDTVPFDPKLWRAASYLGGKKYPPQINPRSQSSRQRTANSDPWQPPPTRSPLID